jgi:hypothetical protein
VAGSQFPPAGAPPQSVVPSQSVVPPSRSPVLAPSSHPPVVGQPSRLPVVVQRVPRTPDGAPAGPSTGPRQEAAPPPPAFPPAGATATGTPAARGGVPVSTGRADPPAAATHPGRPADLPDLDELARRLIEPVGRLLRKELRDGRERAGRLHDRRR